MRENLKKARKAAGLTQQQMADKKICALDRATIVILCLTIGLNVLAYLDKIVSFVRWLLSCLR